MKRMKRKCPSGYPIEMFVVYERPHDFPENFVVRRWEVDTNERPTDDVTVVDSLAAARAAVPPDCVRLERHPSDEPQIVEVWF